MQSHTIMCRKYNKLPPLDLYGPLFDSKEYILFPVHFFCSHVQFLFPCTIFVPFFAHVHASQEQEQAQADKQQGFF